MSIIYVEISDEKMRLFKIALAERTQKQKFVIEKAIDDYISGVNDAK